jgi:hypothetical protein
MNLKVVQHKRKPGWKGSIYDRPWGLPDHLDILWGESPFDEDGQRLPLPSEHVRYPINDLIVSDEPTKRGA